MSDIFDFIPWYAAIPLLLIGIAIVLVGSAPTAWVARWIELAEEKFFGRPPRR
jgi:hypothetical protein